MVYGQLSYFTKYFGLIKCRFEPRHNLKSWKEKESRPRSPWVCAQTLNFSRALWDSCSCWNAQESLHCSVIQHAGPSDVWYTLKDGRRKSTTWEFQRANLTERPQTHSRTQPSHTCANLPSDFLAHWFLWARTLRSLFSWALAAGHLVSVYPSVMLQRSGTGMQTTHTHECYMQIHMQDSGNVS